jgi:hypothetical protein
MASSFKIGAPVYWVEDVYDRSLGVNELHKRRAPTKEIRTGRLAISGSSHQIPEGTVLTLISEEDYRKGLAAPNNSENNSENSEYKRWLNKYPVTMRGGRKRKVRKTSRRRI